MNINRKAHPDCKYFANPFHECASDCLEKISQGRGKKNSKKQAATDFSLTGSFGKKKMGSQPPSPLNNTRPYQNGTANSPRVRDSRPSPIASKQRTTVPETNRSFSPSLSSDEVNGQHDSFNHTLERPLQRVLPLSPNNMTGRSKTVSPRPQEHEHNRKNDITSEISEFNVVSPPRSYANDDDDDDEDGVELDLQSVMSDSCISVGKYRVNSGVSTTLRSILDKHGDIAASCKLESASMRSRYLECLCSLMQELGSTPVAQLTKLKVKEMLAVIKDLESVKMDVGWLRCVLEEFSRFQENEDSEKERQEGLVRSKKQEVEIHEAYLARIEEEVREGRLRLEEMKEELAELETQRLRMEDMRFKVEKFKGRSFLDELI